MLIDKPKPTTVKLDELKSFVSNSFFHLMITKILS